MELSSSFQEFLTLAGFAALVIFNIVLLFKKNTQGTLGEAANTISVLQADIKNKVNEISTLKQDNAGLKATLTEKDHQIQMLSGVFQGGQNSALMKFMDNMTKSIEGFQNYIKNNDERMKQLMESVKIILENLKK